MKDYDRLVIWVDYFNSSLSRSGGRRVPLNMAVRNPTLDELGEAVRRVGYEFELIEASHPRRMFTRSGYISIEKKKPKAEVIREIAAPLSAIRGEQRREAKEHKG